MDALVTMRKGDATLEVHPTCVAAHVLQGWRVVPADPAVPAVVCTDPHPVARAPKAKKSP